ncbi:MAG TPA: efflux RND transporter periplasmic adaptor subunit [Candidatus Sulfotelmatobacter sp.]|nr:efflux RND transporter periplasmic adaptor subunit [Candidatus Sulfotelmatobacter sp.]
MASGNNSNGASRRRWIWLAVAAAAVLLLLSYTRQTPLKVRAAVVERGPIRSLVSTNGKIEPVQNFEAHAPIATTVKRVLVKEGDHVRKGQMLLQLDDADIRSKAALAQAQIKAAQADLSGVEAGGTHEEVLTLGAELTKYRTARDEAQRSLDSLRRLQQQGAASTGEVTAAEEKLKNAQSDLSLAEQKKGGRYSTPEVAKVQAEAAGAEASYEAAEDALAKSSIRAPFDGIVYSLPVKQGSFVQGGDLLLQEADLTHVLVRAFVDEPDIGRLVPGQKVEITWDAIAGRVWTGSVSTIPSIVKQRNARNVGEVTCAVENQDLKLLPNVNVGVTIVTAEHDNVLTLQRDALRADDGKPYVYEIINEHLKHQPVVIALQNLTRVEITSGLAQGAQVALPAEENKPLVDGAAVKVVP